jgi:hypothetical protein
MGENELHTNRGTLSYINTQSFTHIGAPELYTQKGTLNYLRKGTH